VKLKWSGKRTLIALALLGGVLVLYAMGVDEQRAKQGAESETSQECRVTSTVDGLNVRSAPVMDPANVVGQLSAGEEADAHKEVENGFRKLADERWVAVEFAPPLEGRDCG
jgi:hypothetical protein